MNEKAYDAVRGTGAAVIHISPGVVKLSGFDRMSFLNGQVSNDVMQLSNGQTQRACLLSNTGHLMAELHVHAFEDHLLIETDAQRADVVASALDRFLIRERVEIEVVSSAWRIASVQGSGASAVIRSFMAEFVAPRDRTGASGFDCWVSASSMPGLSGEPSLDEETLEVLRVEAGIPSWGSELDETIIPLEARLDKAISYTKGCYMGQEIIARIHSRGHTNRTLMGMRFSDQLAPGDILRSGDGREVGRITSVAISPLFGKIALGYVRNEHAVAGTTLKVAGSPIEIADLPFLTTAR
jgi:folate-binding protein YgfZ